MEGNASVAAVLVLVAGLSFALYFVPRPIIALRNYVLVLPFLPEFLTLKMGVSVVGSRITTLVFLLAMVYRATAKLRPRFDWLDASFVVFLGLYLTAVIPGPPEGGVVFGAGFLVDVALPYYIFRCVVRTTEDIKQLVKGLIVPTYVIVVMAAVQSLTEFNVFDQFKTGEDTFGVYDSGMKRLGLTRADVGLTHYIMMGLFFASQLPIAIGHYAGLGMDFGRILARVVHYPIGAFFSLSGGSFLVAFIGMATYMTWPLRKMWFLLATVGGLAVVYIETFSNRGTAAILATLAATDGDSAWYRIRLPDAVFAKMEGAWWTGFGRDKPDMGYFNDITNHYLWWLLQGGIPVAAAFVACILIALTRLHASSRNCLSRYLVWFNWGLGCSIVALSLGLVTVSLFGQMRTYQILFLAMAACSLAAARDERERVLAGAQLPVEGAGANQLPLAVQT